MTNSLPRGLRINNPGNIRVSQTPWHGKLVPSRDDEFETFDTMENGVRAMMKLILTYNKKYGLKSVRQIINRYAPPSENATDMYINIVADSLGVDADADLDFSDKQEMTELIAAIVKHEQGMPVELAQIETGVTSAIG